MSRSPVSALSPIEIARTLLYERALVEFQGKAVGTVAAIPQKVRSYIDNSEQLTVTNPDQDLNYNEIFIRDNIPVMIYFLIDGRPDIVRNFLEACLTLQSTHPQTTGIFPSSFFVEQDRLVADYGQRAIGRVASVDATLWWPILAHIYVQHTGDQDWARQPQVQLGLQRFLGLILHPWFRDAPTLHVPDGAFMIDRPLDVWGAPLEIQVLLQGALLSAAGLIHQDLAAKGFLTGLSATEDPFSQQQILHFEQALAWVKRLRRHFLMHYWINTETIQVLRRRPTEQYGDGVVNEYNVQTETIPHWLQNWLGSQGGYLIGNIRTGRPDFRFFTLGNCLGAIFDIMTLPQQRSLFRLILHNRDNLMAEMPLRICHPPLDTTDWRNKTGFDPKNRTWCYHNGGHWPCLLWFLVIAVLRHPQPVSDTPLRHQEIYLPMRGMLKDAYEVLLQRLPEQKWAEYFDGPTGVWMGQQARLYQTWSIVGLLLVHHLLRENSADAGIMNLPSLKMLHQVSLMNSKKK